MTYSLWTIRPIIGGSKSPLLMFTIPLVILGIFRYQMLSESFSNKEEINLKSNILETPEKVIFIDRPIQIIIFTWILFILIAGNLS